MATTKQTRAAAKTPATATTSTPAADPRGSLPEHDPRKGVQAPTAQDDEELVKPRASRQRVKEEEDEMVTVSVPKPFKLAHDGADHTYAVGIYEMPRSHAEHWYAKAHDVEIKD